MLWSGRRAASCVVRALLILPPAKTSHEADLFRAMPGWEIVVVAGQGAPDRDASRILPVTRVPILGAPARWTASLAWLRGLDELEVGGIDLVVSLEIFSTVSQQAAGLARRLGVPHAVWAAEILKHYAVYFVPPWRGIAQRIVRSSDLFLCATELARAHLVARGCPPDRCAVVHPGVDVSFWHPAPGGRSAEPVVVFVGELRAARHGGEKGVREVIEACRRVRQRGIELRLVIVGDGPLRPRVERANAKYGFVDFRGPTGRTGVAELLRAARVFCIAPRANPFWAEQFGFAAVEAMASGLPVVITRSGAVSEVVPPSNRIVPEGDLEALSDGIVAALGPDGDECGRQNRRYVLEHYDLVRQGARLAARLTDVVTSARTGP